MANENLYPSTLYVGSKEFLKEQERKNEILAGLAGVSYQPPGNIPKGKNVVEKRLLDAAQAENDILEAMADGGGAGVGANKLAIDYATDVLSLKKGDTAIPNSGVTLPAYGLSYSSATGGLTMTKNGAPMQNQTVALPVYGAPQKASTAAAMTDQDKIYVYTGSESGYISGNWYYYDDTLAAWTSGGTYNSTAFETDDTLLVSGAAADAKATGDAVGELKSAFSDVTGSTANIFDISSFSGVEGITKDQDGFYVGTGSAISNAVGASTDGLPGMTFESDTQYYVQITAYSEGDSTSTSNGLRMRIYYTDETDTSFSFPVNTHSALTKDKVSAAGKTISKIALGYANAPSTVWHFGNIMVTKSSEPVDYVQHATAVDLVAREDIEKLYVESGANQASAKKAYAKANQVVGGDSLIPYNELPSYYKADPESPESYDDIQFIVNRVNSVPAGKHFMLFTDTHWKSNAQKSPLLLDYLSRRLGIKNTIFGGDFIDREDGSVSVKGKFIANQVLNDFSTKVLAACGDGLLPVMGNHDNNFANSDNYQGADLDDLYLPAVPVQKALFNNLPETAHTYWETYGNAVLTAAHNGGISDTDANNAELEANCKLTYYYDDDDQGIRYIVIDAPRPVHGVWEDFVNTQNIVQYIPWLYDVFSSVPEGYDVIIAQHTTVTVSGLETTSQFVRTITGMAMGLKAKANKQIRYSMEDSTIPAYQVYFASYPDAVPPEGGTASRHKFDFRGCPNVGRVIMVCGHVHSDFVAVFTPGDNADNYYQAAAYTGGEIDQTNIIYYDSKPNGVAIPCIWTTTDAYIRTRDVSNPDRLVPMEQNTITEQAIDIYSLTDSGVEITRVGACYAGQQGNIYGYERKISNIPMKW